MKYDFVVIGSGVSGLSTAIVLAVKGCRVAVVEKAGQLAPVLKGFLRRGIHFDTGFHYTGSFARGEVLDTYFRYLGIEDSLEKVPYDQDCFDTFHFPSDEFTLGFPWGYERIRSRLHSMFPGEKSGIDYYLRVVEQEFNSSPHLNLEMTSDEALSFSRYSKVNLKSFLQGLITDPRLAAVLSMHFLLYGTEPGLSSVSIHAQVSGSLYQSVHGIKGGGRVLADALLRRLKELGVDMFPGRGISRIVSSQDKFTGVIFEDGEMLEASGCVSSIHPETLMSMVDERAFRPATRRRFNAFENTTSAFMFSAAMDQLPPTLERKNFFLCPDMDMDNYCRTDRPIENRPFFIASCGLDNPASRKGLVMLCPGSISEVLLWKDSDPRNRPGEYMSFKQRLMQRVREHIIAHVPGISTSLDMLDCATPLTFRDYSNAPSGCLYGIKQKPGQINPSPLTKIRGLFLTGQSLTGPGVLGATVSAFLTCGLIFGSKSLRQEVRQCL